MRLLRRHDAGAFSITKDLVGEYTVPSYAILSRTWVKNQEVALKDLEDGTGEGKSGYDKLRFCAAQAARDGRQYFWWTLAALTSQIMQNFHERSKPCFAGIAMRIDASCIYQMCRILHPARMMGKAQYRGS